MTTTICAPELVTLTAALHVLRGPNTQPHTDDCCQQYDSEEDENFKINSAEEDGVSDDASSKGQVEDIQTTVSVTDKNLDFVMCELADWFESCDGVKMLKGRIDEHCNSMLDER